MNSTTPPRTPGRKGNLPAHLAIVALSVHFAASARAHFEIPAPGSNGTLRWTSRSTRCYRVLASPDLSTWNWISPLPVSGGEGDLTTVSLPALGDRSFYKVIALKPPVE